MTTAGAVPQWMEALDVFSAHTEVSGSRRVSLRSSVCVCTLPWAEKTSAMQRLHLHYAKGGKDVTNFSFIQDILEIL